jgi:magnesium transporter
VRDITRLILPEVREYLAQAQVPALQEALEEFHPADLADVLIHLELDEAARLFGALPLEQRVRSFEHLEEEQQLALVERLGRESLARVLDEMSPDDRADLFKALPARTQDALMPLLAQVERNDVARLVTYAEGTAGALMTTEYTALPAGTTVGEALARLRVVAPNRETIYYVYCTDAERKLQGVVSLREVVLGRPEQPLSALMRTDVITCRVDDRQDTVAGVVERYDFLAVPIVDDAGRLVGIVTHDDALDVVQAENTADAHRMGAVVPLEAPYDQVSFRTIARKRATPLALLFFASTGTALALSGFGATLQEKMILMFFLPLVIAQGGNSGSQAATIVTRALALGEVRGHPGWVALREAAMGLTLGLLVGALAFVVAWGWPDEDPRSRPALIAGVVAFSVVQVIVLGSVLGSASPVVLRRFGVDPAYVSAPLVAAVMDVLGATIYLGTATLFLM